jgi:hypothetical protein
MPLRLQHLLVCVVLPGLLALGTARAEPITLTGRVELPGVNGRIDHLAVDLPGGQLFIAALGANSIEVIDLRSMRRTARFTGNGEPQGVAYEPGSQRLFVTNGGGGTVQVFVEGKLVGTVTGLPDADNLRLSRDGRKLFVGYGEGLVELDVRTLVIGQRITLPAHPEAFELSADASRVYVNVPGTAAVEVVDRDPGKVGASWRVAPLAANFPMALDRDGQRLFVVTRRPAGLLVLDARDGKKLYQRELCGDADDVFFDGLRQRLYAVCGAGEVQVISTRSGEDYALVQRVTTSPGARTGLFVGPTRQLLVAAPRRRHPAEILVFRTD